MGGLALGQAICNNPDGSGVTVTVQLVFDPGSAGATLAMRDYFEWQDDTLASGEILQITSRQADGTETSMPAIPPRIGAFSSNGIAFDPNMSSVTYGFLCIGAFAQWVLQVIFL